MPSDRLRYACRMRTRWILVLGISVALVITSFAAFFLLKKDAPSISRPPSALQAFERTYKFTNNEPSSIGDIEASERAVEKRFALPENSVTFEQIAATPDDLEVFSVRLPGRPDYAGPLVYLKWNEKYLQYSLGST